MDGKTDSYDIFISYSRRDLLRVEEIVTHLRSLGLTIWFDQQSIPYGARIRDSILQGIHASRIVIVFISENSLTSRWVLNELDAAMVRELSDSKSLIVPIILGRIANENIPPDLRAKNYLDLRHNFQKRWLEQRNFFSQNMIALVKGESYGPEAAVFTIGDPLIRYLASYSFEYSGQSNRLERKAMEQIAWAIGVTIAQDDYESDEDAQGTDVREEPHTKGVNDNGGQQIDEHDPSGKARAEMQRFLEYRSDRRRFVQRYGEFSLQQLVLFQVDKRKMDLTGGFSEDELNRLFSDIETILELFSLQFSFQDIGADSTHGILAIITKHGMKFSLYGNVKEVHHDGGRIEYRLQPDN